MPDYRLATRRAATREGVDPGILLRLINQESGFNPNARSGAGAQGIAQFMPATAKAYGVNLNDNRVTDDLQGAARYLRANLDKYGSYARALSVYNSGKPDAYKDPNFAGGQTYNYVRSILHGQTPAAPGAPSGSGGGSGGSLQSTLTSTPASGTGFNPGSPDTSSLAGLLQQPQAPPVPFPVAPTPAFQPPVVQPTQQPSGLADALASIASQAPQGLPDVTAGSSSVKVSGSAPQTRSGTASALVAEANKISNAKVPYQWGGGHQAKAASNSPVTPLDCSGAVSRVLGINPRVSGQFRTWGKPGDGGNQGVTVYSSPTHVLMKINGHFFGTSSTNPGGGAGWIKQSDISPQYLRGFTARHQ